MQQGCEPSGSRAAFARTGDNKEPVVIDENTLLTTIPHALRELSLPWPHPHRSGKVREAFALPEGRLLLVTTDRLSAFDRVLAAIPFKGQVLNQLSAFWFAQTADVVANHLVETPDPNVSLVRECATLPVEVIVRGYITGSTATALWTLYAAGERTIYGYTFPDGLRKNDRLPGPIVTPTTKGGPGQHDERLTCAEVVERGLLDAATWEQVQAAALAIFRRGQAVADRAGFALVDTKYEFGRAPGGALLLVDEVHTPDSSRYWTAESLQQGEPVHWDKEFIRLWYGRQGYRGAGEPPALPQEVVVEAARRYIALYEGLTGQDFQPADYPAEERIERVLLEYRDTGR
ncbi:MAG: phosphoribosylaminoimidazolesuccinocarboxamide synthase [Anaerolineae bacterium]|nr:phosphoribosylaminoimidazolesuccinocarboxamide synthase [Anaerolineae bacterium]